MIHVVLGPDRSCARAALRELVTSLDSSGDNTSRFDRSEDSLNDVLNALSTPSFFGLQRTVVATGFLAAMRSATGSRGRRTKSQAIAPDAGVLQAIVELAIGEPSLVLFDPELAAIPAAISSIIPEAAIVRSHHPPRGRDVVDFTCQAFAERGAEVERNVAQYLLDRLFSGHWRQAASNPAFDHPPDIDTLLSEIDKLAIAGSDDKISMDLIDELTPVAPSDRLFPLLDALTVGNETAALRELEAIPDVEDERQRLLNLLYQQIEYIGAASSPGRPSDPLHAGRQLGMSNPNRMKSILRAVGSSSTPAADLISVALEADRRTKTGFARNANDAIFRIMRGATPSAGDKSTRNEPE
jgi:DNA polymerase III delta subunit